MLRLYEARVAAGARLVTAAGWADTLALSALGIDCHWLPTALPDAEFHPVERRRLPLEGPGDGPGSGKVAGFLGNFDFWPNTDALNTLLRHWLPALRAVAWQLIVAGQGSERLLNLPDDVLRLGPVVDVDDYYAHIDVTLAPIRLGGGMKVKVVESWARGIAMLGTTVAFEGFSPEFANLFVQVPAAGLTAATLARFDALAPIDPGSAQLQAFGQSRLRASVHQLLSEANF